MRLKDDDRLVEPAVGLAIGSDRAIRAQALAALFAAGACLALLTIVLPHSRDASELGLLAIVANAYVIAVVLFRRARTLPDRVLPVALMWGSTLIAGVAYFSGQAPSPLVFFYLWVFLYASYFFTVGETAVQILYAGLAYGVLLAVRPPSTGIAEWWLVGMGSLLVAAILIRSMRSRVETLIGKLYEAARTDPLTGVVNRTGFRDQLDLELERARRSGTAITVVSGDLDHLKEVNDRGGQHAGNAVLRRLAAVLEGGKRKLDLVARVGGGEFALILPDTSSHAAFALCEHLRVEVRRAFEPDLTPVTISLGVATYPGHGETAASLLRATEQALQAAKASGRDRTVLYSTALQSAAIPDRDTRDVAGERFVGLVIDLAEAVDLRFSGSARHSETVGRYAAMMADELGFSEQQIERVRLAGMLHDIGKVSVPDRILKKPGKLSEEELEIIRRHPHFGAELLEHPGLSDVRQWVAAHHERPDGQGYPLGLAGAAIPLEARILAVADAYEAMTSDRSYRASIGHDRARAELQRCAGAQFDPQVVAALLAVSQRDGGSPRDEPVQVGARG
jgi:diguanylate cyclase (GGDEF)-like protein/putative nucleotidyltransferase with HDIG domain